VLNAQGLAAAESASHAMQTTPPQIRLPAVLNTSLVESYEVAVDLSQSSERNSEGEPLQLRYFSLIEPTPPIRLSARSIARHIPDTTVPLYATHLVEADATSMAVIDDSGYAGNAILRRVDGRFFAFGGTFLPPTDRACSERNACQLYDGVHVLETMDLEVVRTGAWIRPPHGWQETSESVSPPRGECVARGGCSVVSTDRLAVTGWHEGAVDLTRTGPAQFDSKLSVVRKFGHWLLYARANVQERGGRHVMVARSRGSSPVGGDDAWDPFQLVEIDGYDLTGPSNIYMMAVDHHPLFDDMLLALLPVNMGQEGVVNGDGESFIALSLSCDGVRWSRLTPLLRTIGRQGRTYDQPVDGLLIEDDHSHFLVHHDVPLISTDGQASRIIKYRVNEAALRRLSVAAREHLSGC